MGLLTFLARRLDWIVTCVLLVVSTPIGTIWTGAPFVLQHPNFADDSWVIDLCFKAISGVWLGRDVIFTYGPLYQGLISLPVRLLGFSLGAALFLAEVVLLWSTVVLIFLLSKLLLAGEPAWKRALFVATTIIFFGGFWTFTARTSVELLLFALFLV